MTDAWNLSRPSGADSSGGHCSFFKSEADGSAKINFNPTEHLNF
jgi:hypothetical protein